MEEQAEAKQRQETLKSEEESEFLVPVSMLLVSGRGRSCRGRAETEMVSMATATLKCNLNKRGCDKVEQTAVSEHV